MADPFLQEICEYACKANLNDFNAKEFNQMIQIYNNTEEESKDLIKMVIKDMIRIYEYLPKLQEKIDEDKFIGVTESYFGYDVYDEDTFIEYNFDYGDASTFVPRTEALLLDEVLRVINNLADKKLIDIKNFEYRDTPFQFIADEEINKIKERMSQQHEATDWAIKEAIAVLDIGWDEYVKICLKRRGIKF